MVGKIEAVEIGEAGHLGRRTHIGEDQTVPLLDGVGGLADRGADRGIRQLAGRFENGAVDVEMPTVIAAAYAALLDTAELQRCTAMRAVPMQQPDAVLAVAENNQ